MSIRRRPLYPAAIGVAVGALVTGLLVPFAVGDDEPATSVGTGGLASQDAGTANDGTGDASADGRGPDDASPSASLPPTTAPAVSRSSSGTRTATGPADSATAATDIGVTADSIKLGFVLIDLAGSGDTGFDFGVDPKQQQGAIQAMVDELNEHGGIAGRRIVPRYARFEVLDSFTGGESGRAACVKLTEDDDVFAVIGYLFPQDQMCVAREHERIMLSDAANNADSGFVEAGGRLLSVYPRAGRIMSSFVYSLDAAGFLAGKKVGIVGEVLNDPNGATARTLADELAKAGHPVVRTTRLSSDLSVAASQMPVEVNQQRLAGAEVILFLVNPLYVQQFAQEAQSQGWYPRYGFSDFANGTADPSNDMPESLDGALGVAGAYPGAGTKDTTGWEEPAAAVRCREVYERRTRMKLAARGSGDNSYAVTLNACDDLRLFKAVADLAGAGLTRATFVDAVRRLGPVDGLGRIPGGSFGPGKSDFADFVRLQVYDKGCDCFHPRGGFTRMR